MRYLGSVKITPTLTLINVYGFTHFWIVFSANRRKQNVHLFHAPYTRKTNRDDDGDRTTWDSRGRKTRARVDTTITQVRRTRANLFTLIVYAHCFWFMERVAVGWWCRTVNDIFYSTRLCNRDAFFQSDHESFVRVLGIVADFQRTRERRVGILRL